MFKNSHWNILLVASLAFAGAAQAQNLTLTVAESGNFLVQDCSAISPKYVNYPLLSVNPTTGLKTLITVVPGRCISTITLFVKNIGALPSGPVTLQDTMLNAEPKGTTILNGGVDGGLSFTSNGYTCNIQAYMSAGECKHAALAPGEGADLTLNVLMEDFGNNIHPTPGNPRVTLDNIATVSGGVDTDPTDNSRFELTFSDLLTQEQFKPTDIGDCSFDSYAVSDDLHPPPVEWKIITTSANAEHTQNWGDGWPGGPMVTTLATAEIPNFNAPLEDGLTPPNPSHRALVPGPWACTHRIANHFSRDDYHENNQLSGVHLGRPYVLAC